MINSPTPSQPQSTSPPSPDPRAWVIAPNCSSFTPYHNYVGYVRCAFAHPALPPPERQISRPPPRRARLRLVPRRRPTRPRQPPVVDRLRLPGEQRRGQKSPQRPARVIVDVGGEPQFPARAKHPRQSRDVALRYEPALALPPLRPGVRI